MPWGRIDDSAWRHAKVANLAEDLRKGCVSLYWLAISWCNDGLTDGAVPAGALRILGGDVGEAIELVRVGLWETTAGGWQVHDFLDFNKSRAQVEQDRRQRKLAGAAGARSRWGHGGEMDGGQHGETDGGPDSDSPSSSVGEMDAPSPVSRSSGIPESRRPAPFARDGQWPNLSPDAIGALERMSGRPWEKAGSKQIEEFDRQVGDHGLPAVVAAMERVAGHGKMTAPQLVWGARKVLEPIPEGRAVSGNNGHAVRETDYDALAISDAIEEDGIPPAWRGPDPVRA